LRFAEELILEATKHYNIEDDRSEKMREMLSDKLGTIVVIEYGENKRQQCKSDGVLLIQHGLYIAYSGVIEIKNEIGTGKNDPTIQGAIYYRDYWSQNNVRLILILCANPCIHIIM
jgi:hypothetical protein